MADKEYNIRLPDGTALTVPAWATEDTLVKLSETLKQANIIDQSILSKMDSIKVDSSQLQSALGEFYNSVVNTKTEFEKQADATEANTKKVTAGIAGAVDSLANTEKPLTKMVDYANRGITGIGDSFSSAIPNMSKSLGVGKKGLETFSSVLGGLTTAGMAYAGFVAGQVEQLAAAQKVMIDSGAIFRDASEVGVLVDRVKQTGITYTKLSEIVSQYTRGIAYVGDSTATGAQAFVERFDVVMQDLEQFGDFGFSVDEIADAYANYLEIARLRQFADVSLANNSSALDIGFQNLLAESSALSTLTGQSRSDILSRTIGAFQDPKLSAGLAVMARRNTGLAATVEEATKLFQTRATDDVEQASGGLFTVLQSALNEAVTNYRGRPEDFEITSFLAQIDPTLTAALQKTGVLDEIETALKTDNVGMLKKAVDIDLPNAILNMDLFTQSQTAVGKRLVDIQTAMIPFQQQFGALAEKDQTEIDSIIETTKKNMSENAAGVAAINNFKTEFLKIQAAITPNLQDASEVVRKFSSTLTEATEMIQKVTGLEYSDFVIESQISDSDRMANIRQRIAGDEQLTPEDRELLEDMVVNIRKSKREDLNATVKKYLAGPEGFESTSGSILAAIVNSGINATGFLGDLLEDSADLSVSDGSSLLGDIIGSDPEAILEEYNKLKMQQRAFGGPVTAGQPYIVGERGPEIMVPRENGMIQPNNKISFAPAMDNSSVIDEIIASKQHSLETMRNLERVVDQMLQNNKLNRTTRDYS